MEPEHRSTVVILSVGHDAELLSTRQLLLQSVGYLVESVSSVERAIKSLCDGDFDLVIMCHSLSQEEKMLLTHRIHEDGLSLPVVIMTAGHALDPDWLATASSVNTPVALLHNVKAALQQERAVRTK